jgi:mannose-6-phosphate isomerase-like protein (cupin superfamily)
MRMNLKIGEADRFRFYVTAGKTISSSPDGFHQNPRDVFMLILEGEVEFVFQNGKRTCVKSGECFVLPKQSHRCIFKTLTIAIGGVVEEGL